LTSRTDDGFHEIQLNGKQLVFLFMAATVVSVVIFLCGVLVGRGVRGGRMTAENAAPLASADDLKPDFALGQRPPTVVQPGDDPTKAAPPPPIDGETSREVARGDTAEIAPKPAGTAEVKITPAPPAKPAADPRPASPATLGMKPVLEAARPAASAPKAAAPAPDPGPAAPPPTEPSAKPAVAAESGDAPLPAADDTREGWVVQVAAVKTRGEADTMVKRLSSKGYSAFVLASTPNVFRVRVGGYKQKRDAEIVAAKLRKDEHINPWVTR
jgi:cell division septation protein DedD